MRSQSNAARSTSAGSQYCDPVKRALRYQPTAGVPSSIHTTLFAVFGHDLDHPDLVQISEGRLPLVRSTSLAAAAF
jgi:hypothetical protein